MSFLEVSGIGKQLQGTWVLKDIAFTQQPLERIAIVGETGSGKSTLVKIIGGWEQATTGEVLFNGQKIPGTDEKLLPGHTGIAYLSQQYGLPQHLRIEQVLEYANKGTEREGQTAIGICRIGHLLKRKTSQLSGGEQQRVALCRQLVGKPRLLLLDEPFSNLDRVHKDIIKEMLRAAEEQLSVSCILVSHDPLDVLSWANKLLVLQDGKLVQQGTPEVIYRQPANVYVAGLLGAYNLVEANELPALAGLLPKQSRGKKVLIRPEQLALVNHSGTSIDGVISAIRFMGSYYEVKVSVRQRTFLVKTTHQNIKTGDKISLQLNGPVWHL